MSIIFPKQHFKSHLSLSKLCGHMSLKSAYFDDQLSRPVLARTHFAHLTAAAVKSKTQIKTKPSAITMTFSDANDDKPKPRELVTHTHKY